MISVRARTRWSSPEWMSSSTAPLKFSAPPSTSKVGVPCSALRGGEEDFGGGRGIEGGRDLPSQDAAREVVDHRVQIGSASIE